ncbi:hypothetical protein [Nocardia carnea]|uniref:hypothetical protein n=1 Tax=Nocardia carnea TaxID=37328 RepID=UPI002456FB26|nr:hypothetical protein [Nocardia carnea]
MVHLTRAGGQWPRVDHTRPIEGAEPGRHNRLPDHAHDAMAQFHARHPGRAL